MPDATVHGQQVEEGTPEGDVQRPTATPQVAEALKKLAQRIRTFAEGIFPPSPPPALLDRITDELLVLSSDVVAGVARDGQAISANAALRLLAWTVADARGATVALDGPLALTVGKRLNRQAQSVQASLARAEAGRVGESRVRCLFDGGQFREIDVEPGHDLGVHRGLFNKMRKVVCKVFKADAATWNAGRRGAAPGCWSALPRFFVGTPCGIQSV